MYPHFTYPIFSYTARLLALGILQNEAGARTMRLYPILSDISGVVFPEISNLKSFFINIFSKATINGSRSNVHKRYVIPSQGTESPTQGLLNQLQLLDIEKINTNFSWLENKQDDLGLDNKDTVMVISGVSQSGKYKQWEPNKFQELCSFLERKGFYIFRIIKYNRQSNNIILINNLGF